MTKKIQEITLSIFLTMCSISLLFAIIWLKPLIESQQLLIDETRKNQDEIMTSVKDTKEILNELGYAIAVIAMTRDKMIQPSDANKMIEGSIDNIEAHSSRLGKLAKIVNEQRINNQGR
ncbi:MAG: hypothetical protein HQM07_08245 [Zetaproteobacteria bacterium]|nr:hypothetical protein [Zetaproteobacteria bacterium]